jgi:hypothetical protein
LSTLRTSLLRLATSLALLLVAACASGPKVQTQVYERPDGVIVVETLELEATVTAINATTREIRLQPRHGDEQVVTADEAMVNFGQVRVGDTVRAVLVEQLAVNLVPGGSPESADGAAAVALAPEGAKPGLLTVDTVEITGTIVAIDGHDHTVVLQFLDGSTQEIQVAKHRDLSQVGLGDSVRIQLTEAVAILVETPEAR